MLPLLVSTIFLILSCNEKKAQEDNEWGEIGTVRLGFCWLIVTDDNIKYEPINLNEEYQLDSLRVRFEYDEKNDLDSTCMQGTIINLTRIEKL